MKACFHECVCRHLVALGYALNRPCPINEICKFYAGAPEDKKGKAAKKPCKRRLESDPPIEDIDTSGISEKQFKKAKKKIENARQNKGLTENQESALVPMKRLRFKKMTGEQKKQIVNIANDL